METVYPKTLQMTCWRRSAAWTAAFALPSVAKSDINFALLSTHVYEQSDGPLHREPLDCCPWGAAAGRRERRGCRPRHAARPPALHRRRAPAARRIALDAGAGRAGAAAVPGVPGQPRAGAALSRRPATALRLATVSIVVKTLVLYAIMVTGSIWEKDVFGRYLFAPAFFWEDVVSMLVLALHTAYLVALFVGRARRRRGRCWLALAAYATYVVNADAVPAEAARGAARQQRRGRRRRRWAGVMNALRAAVTGRRAAAAPIAPVLRERGQREVFCGLTGIIWLHRKIQDAFFLVVGSRTCAHLIQSAAGVMIFAEPRFATAIIDERDLAGLADANDELDRVVDAAAGAAARHQAAVPGRLLPVRGDQARPVARGAAAVAPASRRTCACSTIPAAASRRPSPQGEDACLAVAGADLPASRRTRRVAAGRRRARRCRRGPVRAAVRRARHRAGRASCRRAAPATCRRSGPNTRFLLAQPFLAETARALEERGATAHRRAVPARRRRHDALARRPRPTRSASTPVALRRASPRLARERAARGRSRAIATELAGKRIFFFPDSQLEVPLARFLARELGMRPRRGRHALSASPASRRGTRAAARRHAASAKARTSTGSSTAAAPRGPTSSSAASASPIRSRPRA